MNSDSLLRPLAMLALAACFLGGSAAWAGDAVVPEAVRATLDEVAPGWSITELGVEDEDDGVRYEIHLRSPEGRFELKVTGDGTILEFQFEAEDGHAVGDWEREEDDDLDSDGDHFPDRFERDHRGDPWDGTRIPQLLELQVLPGTDGPVLELSVATVAGMVFQIEHCPAGGSWTAFGEPITGDGYPFLVEMAAPGGEEGGCGLFRVRVLSDAGTHVGDPDHEGNPDGETDPEPCEAPETLAGHRLVVSDGDGARTLDLQSRTTGVIIEREDDGEIEFTPFSYQYERISECLGRLTLVFPTIGGGDTETVYLAFESDQSGAVVVREADDDDDHLEFERTGRFHLAAR